MRRRVLAIALLLATGSPSWGQHAGDVIMGSAAAGGGALRTAYDFAKRVVVTPAASFDGQTLFSTTVPGFDALIHDEPANGLFALVAGTPVRVEVVALDAGVSLKFDAVTLDAPGESASLGAMPDLHHHPEWRLILPDGVLGEYHVSFRLTTTAAAYGPSVAYTATVTNTTTTTTTVAGDGTTTSTTSTAAPASTTTTTTLAATDDRPIGGRLVLAAHGRNPARRTLLLQSRDPRLALGESADPTRLGATLRVRAATAHGFDGTYALQSSGWSALSRARGFRYRDRSGARGPVRDATIVNGTLLHVAGRGAQLVQTLGVDPEPVDVVLTVGPRRHCLRLGGTVRFRPGRRFVATGAPAPEACAP